MRGCFGGCTFCSITEHEGRIIQSRSEASILREIEQIRDTVAGLHRRDLRPRRAHGQHVSPGLQGPARSRRTAAAESCVYPGICENLNTDHAADPLYRKARALPGIKKVLIASGLRYDLAVKSPEYVKELVHHHVGGYLKIAPEAHPERAAVEDDEAGHGQLRPLQGAVRPLFEGRRARSST
jgi:radical SAM superfamily enzyme YgiQ (UPF0313 family)